MLQAAELHAKAAEYRSAAQKQSDARTREQYLAVAEYLHEWAVQAEVMAAGSEAESFGRQAG